MFQPRRILALLAQHQTRFILVGGVAVQLHGRSRTTVDADILVDFSNDNLTRLAAALTEMQARVKGSQQPARIIQPDLLAGWGEIITFETPYGEIAILHTARGGHTYETVIGRTERAEIAGHEIRVPTREMLIAMKRDAGRSIDEEDVAAVEALGIIDELGPPEEGREL